MNDLRPVLEGDSAFVGLDLRTHPAELPAGILARSENVRLTDGKPVPRLGVSWQTPAGLSLGGPVYHAGVYRPAEGNDQLALALPDRMLLWDTTHGTFEPYYYPAGQTVEEADPLDWVQAGIGSGGTMPEGYLLRGFDKTVLQLKDNNPGIAIASLSAPTAATGAAFTGGFPAGEWAMFYQDRLAVGATRQRVDVSAFLDFTTWSQIEQFQILKGGDDYLVGVIPFQGDKVLIFGRRSIHLAYFDPETGTGTYYGATLGGNSYLRQITRSMGCMARRTISEDGGTVYFLSDHGFVALTPTLDLNLIGAQIPVSNRLAPLLNRLSHNYASGACAVAHRERIYLAVPIADVPAAQLVERAVVMSASRIRFYVMNVGTAFGEFATPAVATGATVEISGFANDARALNGIREVQTTATDSAGHPYFEINARPWRGGSVGSTIMGAGRAWAQAVVTRNNTVLVLNKANAGSPDGGAPYWESVDTLPAGVYADFLLVADAGSQRRVWLVDRDLGPALYEEGLGDEPGTTSGGFSFPVAFPLDFSAVNFTVTPVAPSGITTRRFSFGNVAQMKPIKCGRVRLGMKAGDQAAVTLDVVQPDETVSTITQEVMDRTGDAPVRIPCGWRGIAAQVAVEFEAGQPAVNSVQVETLVETEKLTR